MISSVAQSHGQPLNAQHRHGATMSGYCQCSHWANSKTVTSFSKSSEPRFDRQDRLRMILKRKGFGGVVENCGVQTLSKNWFFFISSSRPSERHAVDTVGVDLFVIYRGRLCDLPPMSGHGLDGHALRGAFR